jgi:predicted restriction endonuclease
MASWQTICANLNTGKSGGSEAVNKPLLLLFILSAVAKGAVNRFVFSECEATLRDAQERFGSDPTSSPHMAFWHLQSDGCWEVENASSIPLGKNINRPNISTLRRLKVAGRVPDSLWQQIARRPAVRRDLANCILFRYFKEPDRTKVAVFFWLG